MLWQTGTGGSGGSPLSPAVLLPPSIMLRSQLVLLLTACAAAVSLRGDGQQRLSAAEDGDSVDVLRRNPRDSTVGGFAAWLHECRRECDGPDASAPPTIDQQMAEPSPTTVSKTTTVPSVNIGIWHQSMPLSVRSNETLFAAYCSKYIGFITKYSVTKAFFLVQDPHISPWLNLSGSSWLHKYWLSQLPSNCAAALFLDAEPSSMWNGASQTMSKNDTMERAFQLVAVINSFSSAKRVTSIAFDWESEGDYTTSSGQGRIASLYAQYVDSTLNDWGWATTYTGIPAATACGSGAYYPELYWVESPPTTSPDFRQGWYGDVTDYCHNNEPKPKFCGSPNTLYSLPEYINDATSLYGTSLGYACDRYASIYSNSSVWPMFSVERVSDLTANPCLQSLTDPNANNVCGIFDAFGLWDSAAFLNWLALVHSNNKSIVNLMIYEWNFSPASWL